MLSTKLKKRKAGVPAGAITSFFTVKRGPGRPRKTEETRGRKRNAQRAAKEANEASKEAGRAEREESKKRKREESAAKGPAAYETLKEHGLQSLKRWQMESIALHYFNHELAAKNKDGANAKNADRLAELQELMRDKAYMLPRVRKPVTRLGDDDDDG